MTRLEHFAELALAEFVHDGQLRRVDLPLRLDAKLERRRGPQVHDACHCRLLEIDEVAILTDLAATINQKICDLTKIATHGLLHGSCKLTSPMCLTHANH